MVKGVPGRPVGCRARRGTVTLLTPHAPHCVHHTTPTTPHAHHVGHHSTPTTPHDVHHSNPPALHPVQSTLCTAVWDAVHCRRVRWCGGGGAEV